ncbi:terminase small subunit [Gemella sp. GL1.1]|nr:terminase small subunit [Gemella sp. GL1.1]NYS27084.1 terminase small subunit [Gemella sp. GL1]
MKKRSGGKLNERQRRFADEHIISGNVYQSAIKAGYSERYAKTDAHKIRENPSVKSYIDKRLEGLKKTTIATQSEVLEGLTAIFRQETTEEVKQLSPLTGQVVEYEKKPSITEVITAGKELLKRFPIIPIEKQLEKYELELEKLRIEVGANVEGEEEITGFIFDRSEYNE